MIPGNPTAQMAIELNSRMNTGLHNASRLIRSETMHQMNEINKASMKELGVTKVQEIVTFDERTFSECSPHNKKIHDIDKAPILLRHPNCRCVLVPYVDVDKIADEFDRREDEILLNSEIDKFLKSDELQDINSISKMFSKDKYFLGRINLDNISEFDVNKKIYLSNYDISRILMRHGNQTSVDAIGNLFNSIKHPDIITDNDRGTDDKRILIFNRIEGDHKHYTEMALVEKDDSFIIHFLMKRTKHLEKELKKHNILHISKK
ncbi:minor capsid protein [Helcococcus ovis]|uniref:minor capsid protein n=1 Tax=Helcococcus ovis TaxID=72026 RepID=UPI0038B75155